MSAKSIKFEITIEKFAVKFEGALAVAMELYVNQSPPSTFAAPVESAEK